MFDKQIAKKLEQALNNVDPNKLNKVKEMLQNEGDVVSKLQNLNTQSAKEKLKGLNLDSLLNNGDINNVLNAVKNNPDLLNELKKKL